jgi:hypothetical protein
MLGQNLTRFPAMLLRSVIDEERMGASMLTRVTYDVRGVTLVVADEQTWVVDVNEMETPLGSLRGDQPYRKDGVDLFVINAVAYAPNGEACRRVDLRFAIGEFESKAVCFGPRVWRKRPDKSLAPSDPEAFVSMPLGWEVTFGGTVVIDEIEAPYPYNGKGIGLYVDAAAAENKPLPRLEDPAALITKWDDKPHPVGFGLCQFPEAIRLIESAVFADNEVKSFRSRMFNQAFPKMIAPSVKAGDRAVLEGFSPDGPFTFVIPESHLQVRLQLGDKYLERPLSIEEIGVDIQKRQVFIGYRYPFRYVFVPEQLRICTLAVDGT